MHEVLVNRLGGLSLPRKSVVRLTDRPDMTLDVYRGRKTAKQQFETCLRLKNDLTYNILRKCTCNTYENRLYKNLDATLYRGAKTWC